MGLWLSLQLGFRVEPLTGEMLILSDSSRLTWLGLLTPVGAGTAWEVAEAEAPCFPASRALFLMARGSPFSITRSLITRLHRMGTVEESEVKKDIPT